METVIIHKGGTCEKKQLPDGEAESEYCEIYNTLPPIQCPYSFDLGKMFLDGVTNANILCKDNDCHGVLITKASELLVYGTDTYLGIVYGCMACTGLHFVSE